MENIFDKFFRQRKRFFSKKPKDLVSEVNEELKCVKNELDEHLEAINQSTGEIQDSYGCINEISIKMEKLAERLERIELFLQTNSNFIIEEGSFDVKPLTFIEQQVFLVIYALEDEKGLVSCAEISRKTALPNSIVSDYITRLVEKGIPLMKKYINNIPFIRLNPEFKRLQAKENILCIDTAQKELVNF